MAKMTQEKEMREFLAFQGGWTRQALETIEHNSGSEVATYRFVQSLRRNVEFILLLSGNSAFRMEVPPDY